VANDEMRINTAYKLIHDMELGNDDNCKRLASGHIKAAKALLSEENFAVLEELGGDMGEHVDRALEVYMWWLQGQGGAAAPDYQLGTGQAPAPRRIEGRD
jgi:hypothetical protein